MVRRANPAALPGIPQMSKAAATYVVMIGVLVAGLWLIIGLGSHLRAPTDLSGRWELVELPSAGAIAANAAPPATDSITVEQSGQFVRVRFDSGLALDLRMSGSGATRLPGASAAKSGVLTPVVLVDGSWTMRWAQTGNGASCRVELTGPSINRMWQAQRLDSSQGDAVDRATSGKAGTGAAHSGGEAQAPGAAQRPGDAILVLLIQIALILALSRAMGMLFSRIGQPQVMGEMIAGIMLGPSLFGWLFPHAWATLFPAGTIRYLNVLSQLGVAFFLFLVGLELNPKLMRHRGHAAVVISHASIIVPFLLGSSLALYLYGRVFNAVPHMRFTPVALFMGAAMSITAFPVLARILTERNIHKTKMGAITIACAAVDDVTAWCMLALVVGYARAEGPRPAIITAGLAVAYVLVMLLLVRPFLKRLEVLYERRGALSQNQVAVILLLTLVSAYTTERIGIHALFGAFLMGAIMPKASPFVRALSEKLEDYTVVCLLPLFFAYTGLKTQIGLLNRAELWFDTGLIISVACLGKFGGSAVAARACGLGWRESGAIGTLMNTRGLMELVILTIGRELGVISDAVFAMMVIMALVTTALTAPGLSLIYPLRLFRRAAPFSGQTPPERAYSIVIPVSLPQSGKPLAQLADMISGNETTDRFVTALWLRRPVEHEAYRSGLDAEQEAENYPTLQPLLAEARRQDLPVEAVSFMTRDIASDIAAVAESRCANLVLMGFHKPVIGTSILGGTVHRVLMQTRRDVAVFVDRGLREVRSVLVPILGGVHDRLAMELAGRIARNTKSALTVLHVVPPRRRQGDARRGVKQVVEQAFNDPTQPTAVNVQVVEDASPVDAALRVAPQFDLVVVGVGEEWGLESHLFGWRSERIARDCPSSLLIVRKYQTVADRLALRRPGSQEASLSAAEDFRP